MDTLYILLLFGVLAYSVYSAIIYYSRRSRDKKTSQEALAKLTRHRRLTREERTLLENLVADETLPGKRFKLADENLKGTKRYYLPESNDVYLLRGDFNRHGITTRYNEEWHTLIGGLEVYLDERGLKVAKDSDNVAEVVKTKKHPLVLTLNDRFSLTRTLAAEQQLKEGTKGKLPDRDPEDELEAELVSSRNQTVYEREALDLEDAGVGGALVFGLALILIGVGYIVGNPALWLALPGGALALLGLWMLWRRPKWTEGKEEAVRCLRAVPEVTIQFKQQADDSPEVAGMTLHIGDLDIKPASHWIPFILWKETEKHVDVEVMTYPEISNYQLLSYGPHLSLHEEAQRFPPVQWLRHVVMAIVIGIALFMALVVTSAGLQSPIFLLGSLGLLALHGALAIQGRRKNKKRKENIQKYYEQKFGEIISVKEQAIQDQFPSETERP